MRRISAVTRPPLPSATSDASRRAAISSASRTNASGSIVAGGASTTRAARRTPRPIAKAEEDEDFEADVEEAFDSFEADVEEAFDSFAAKSTSPRTAISPRPSGVSRPEALLAVYRGNARGGDGGGDDVVGFGEERDDAQGSVVRRGGDAGEEPGERLGRGGAVVPREGWFGTEGRRR